MPTRCDAQFTRGWVRDLPIGGPLIIAATVSDVRTVVKHRRLGGAPNDELRRRSLANNLLGEGVVDA